MKNNVQIGLGFRRDIADQTIKIVNNTPDFLEIAPENWMSIGGFWRNKLKQASEKYPIFCHGLSLSIGSPDPLNIDFVKKLKFFLDEFNISIYSEHLSYSQTQNAHLYDLLPIPFRFDAVKHIVQRIKIVQDILERPLILENVSYYATIEPEMKEHEFILYIVENSGCKLLFDVNNVYVNSFNHKYDSKEFIKSLPLSEIEYIHIAGHKKISDDLIIDTHGSPIIDPVFELLEWSSDLIKPVPILLERDFNIPSINELMDEISIIRKIVEKKWIQKSI